MAPPPNGASAGTGIGVPPASVTVAGGQVVVVVVTTRRTRLGRATTVRLTTRFLYVLT